LAKFKFIDLFAGIGGIRYAFEQAGGECVFSSEYDKYSQLTYNAFYREMPHFQDIMEVNPPGDITLLKDANKIPEHNILLGGFPCQPFSLAGVSKKQSLGRPHGFSDPTQGTLFFDIKRIIKAKNPEAFLLENVKNIVSHDKHNTFRIILETLDKLEYDVFPRVIDSSGWVPQRRQRIYIVGFRRPTKKNNQKWKVENFDELEAMESPKGKKALSLADILEDKVPDKYTLGIGTWATLKRHKAHHTKKGQGFGYGIISPPFAGKISRTLSARYHKDGAEILIEQKGKRPRRLTPLECLRLMGFPKKFEKYFDRINPELQPVSDTQAYRQFGNAVAVPVVSEIARLMVSKLMDVGAFKT
jgi:DNA (cytosine-5)-methyltransferase 1